MGTRGAQLLSYGIAAAGLLGCGHPSEAPVEHKSSGGVLAPEVIAQVGQQTLGAEFVAQVARAQGKPAQVLLTGLVRELLFAEHARATAPKRSEYLERTVLARRVSQLYLSEARAQGEPTEAEVLEFTARHWVELDRPPMARASHALVSLDERTDLAAARAIAQRLHVWLLELKSEGKLPNAEQFRTRAQEFKAGDVVLKVEALQPVTSDGRVAVPGVPLKPGDRRVSYVTPFAEAVNALAQPGDLSSPVETQFGVHILYLEEKFEPERVPYERRAKVLLSEIVDHRAKALHEAALKSQRAVTSLEVARAASELMGLVEVEP
jgi:hypothetical protein